MAAVRGGAGVQVVAPMLACGRGMRGGESIPLQHPPSGMMLAMSFTTSVRTQTAVASRTNLSPSVGLGLPAMITCWHSTSSMVWKILARVDGSATTGKVGQAIMESMDSDKARHKVFQRILKAYAAKLYARLP